MEDSCEENICGGIEAACTNQKLSQVPTVWNSRAQLDAETSSRPIEQSLGRVRTVALLHAYRNMLVLLMTTLTVGSVEQMSANGLKVPLHSSVQ